MPESARAHVESQSWNFDSLSISWLTDVYDCTSTCPDNTSALALCTVNDSVAVNDTQWHTFTIRDPIIVHMYYAGKLGFTGYDVLAQLFSAFFLAAGSF